MSTSKYINCLNDIENTVSHMSSAELEILSKETEETLEALLSELRKRSQEKQHADISNLEEHLKSADTSFKSLKSFIALALKGIKD